MSLPSRTSSFLFNKGKYNSARTVSVHICVIDLHGNLPSFGGWLHFLKAAQTNTVCHCYGAPQVQREINSANASTVIVLKGGDISQLPLSNQLSITNALIACS